MNKPDAASPFS